MGIFSSAELSDVLADMSANNRWSSKSSEISTDNGDVYTIDSISEVEDAQPGSLALIGDNEYEYIHGGPIDGLTGNLHSIRITRVGYSGGGFKPRWKESSRRKSKSSDSKKKLALDGDVARITFAEDEKFVRPDGVET